MARLIHEELTPENSENILRPEVEYSFEDFPEVRDNYIPDQSGVGYPKRVIFMGTNTSELYINNTDYLKGEIVFLPQENKLMVYSGDEKFIELKITTDEFNQPIGLLVNGEYHSLHKANETSIQNLSSSETYYKTGPEDIKNLI